MELRDACWMTWPLSSSPKWVEIDRLMNSSIKSELSCLYNFPAYVCRRTESVDSSDESVPSSVDFLGIQPILVELNDSSLVSIFSLPISPYFCCQPQSAVAAGPEVPSFSDDRGSTSCLSGHPTVLVRPDVFCVLLQFANDDGHCGKSPLIISWGALKATVVRMIVRGQFFLRYGIHFGNFDDLVWLKWYPTQWGGLGFAQPTFPGFNRHRQSFVLLSHFNSF